MAVKNFLEPFVEERLQKMLDETPTLCRCQKCRDDMLAMTLNGLKPRYKATENVNSESLQLSRADEMDIWLALAKAAAKVGERPRHEEDGDKDGGKKL